MIYQVFACVFLVCEKVRDSDDSDFDLDSSDRDSDESDCFEEDELARELCNTMLLLGPHGVGKTALVYALAEQLGYKVRTSKPASAASVE